MQAKERLRRLYRLVEDGLTEMDDILKDRITALKSDGERVQGVLDRAKAGSQPVANISAAMVARFSQLMQERLTSGEVPFRKAYLRAIVDRVEVDDQQIRIIGRKELLERAVLANGVPKAGVRSFVRKWRTGQDSNPRPPNS